MIKPELIFRFLVSPLFIVSGLGHLMRSEYFSNRLNDAPWGKAMSESIPASFLIQGSGIALLGGGVLLLLGLRVKIVSRLLIGVLLPITLIAQTNGMEDIGPFLKNLAIMGALLYFSSNQDH